jgi:3-oxoacyl-[acyl-carrier protein] reductase
MSDGTISLAIPPQPTGMRMLAGKRVLVTAAAGTGIGSSVARRALEEGASVVISDAHERRLGETLATLEPLGTVFAIRCDVTQQADIDALWAFATEKLGGVDVLINNAGLGGTAPLAEMTDEQWARVLDVSLTGTFRMMRAAMQQMRNGTIVNNASVLGWRAQAGQAHYAAAKAGVMALTRCAAVEGAALNLRVNAVAPSLAMHANLARVTTPELLKQLESASVQGRAAEPWEVANVMLFLASDLSSYLTGEVLSVSSQHP